jgi:hypothetical protein
MLDADVATVKGFLVALTEKVDSLPRTLAELLTERDKRR